MSQSSNNFHRILIVLIAMVFVGALATFAYNGTFSRIMYDDYCTAATGLESGTWGGMLWWYNNWSGLYSNFIVKSALATSPPALYALLPATLIVGWMAALWVFFGQLLTWANIPRYVTLRIGLILLIVFATFNSAPTRQNIYWFAATIPYTMPIIFFTLLAALWIWLVRDVRTTRTTLITTVILTAGVFITNGFSETYGPFLLTAIFFMMVLVGWKMPERRRMLLIVLLSMFFAAVIGLLIVVIAPGNEIRQARALENLSFTTPPPALELVRLVLLITSLFFVIEIYGLAHLFLVMFGVMLLGVWVLRDKPDTIATLPVPRRPLRAFLLASVITFLVVGAILTPGIYATRLLLERPTFLARAVQLSYAMLCGYWLAVWLIRSRVLVPLRKRPIYQITRAMLILMLLFFPLTVIITNLSESGNYRQFAQSWDVRHAQIQDAVAQGATTVTVHELPYYFEDPLQLRRVDANGRYTSCGLRYYGIESITVLPLDSAPND